MRNITSEGLRLDSGFPERRATQHAFGAVLETVPYGVIVLGGDRQPIHYNSKAADVLQAHGGLGLSAGGLAAETYEETKILRELIAGAIDAGLGNGNHPGGTMSVTRSEDMRRIHVLVTPLTVEPHQLGANARHACSVVYVTLPEQEQEYSVDHLMALFDLTKAEARLLGELANGKCLEDACEVFGISIHTARSQLRTLFEKTGASRQAELVKLVLTGPAPLMRPA